MARFRKCLLILFILPGYCLFAQPAATIHKMDSLYHSCLNKGADMLGCSNRYYVQMDSMLNVVYNKLRVRFDTNGRIKLKTDEINWLTKRDEYFKSLSTKDYGTDGNDREMMMQDDKAAYVRKRVIELLNKLTY